MSAFLVGTAFLWTLLNLWALLYTLKEMRESRVRWRFARRRKFAELDRLSTRDYHTAKSLAFSLASATVIGAVTFARDMSTLLAPDSLEGDASNIVTRTLFIVLAAGIANAVRVQRRERNRRV